MSAAQAPEAPQGMSTAPQMMAGGGLVKMAEGGLVKMAEGGQVQSGSNAVPSYVDIVNAARKGVRPTLDTLEAVAPYVTDQQALDIQAMIESPEYIPTVQEVTMATIPPGPVTPEPLVDFGGAQWEMLYAIILRVYLVGVREMSKQLLSRREKPMLRRT